MADYDLNSDEGRQQARDDGYWVGEDSSGNIVAEYGYVGGNADQPMGGGGGGEPNYQSGGQPAAYVPNAANVGVEPVYQTKNGPRTMQQMQAELMSVGWGGIDANSSASGRQQVIDTYARTTGQAVAPSVGGGTGSTPNLPGVAPAAITPRTAAQTGMSDWERRMSDFYMEMYRAAQANDLAAFNEAKRRYDQEYAEGIRQFNLGFGVTEAGLTGTYQGQPTLARQAQEFGQGVTAAGLTGTYQGQPTLPAMTSYADQFGAWAVPTAGQPTLEAQQQQYAQGLGAITTAAGLQANPFRQQQVIGQLGRILSGQGVAGFQAPNTVAGVGTAGGAGPNTGLTYMRQLLDDIQNPAPNQASVQRVLDAIPTPVKINSADFLRSSPSTQSMILQGMQEKYGLNPADSLQQIKNTLPGFPSPTTFGTVRG